MRGLSAGSLSLALAVTVSGCGGRSSLLGAELYPEAADAGAGGGGAGGGGGHGAGGRGAGGGLGGAAGASTTGSGGRQPGTCGDGVVDPGEQCDEGASNRDSPALHVVQGAGFSADAMPLDRQGDVALFYTYQDGSSHTLLEELGESRLYLYRDTTTGILSLVANHGIDQITSGQDQPESRVKMTIVGLPDATTVSVVDDDATELSKTSPATASGDWHFVHSTDGGALSGFPLPGDWSVTVAPSFLQGITAFSWVDSEEMHHPLILDQPVTITAESKAAACRANCTVPRCGDGIVDAGEVCDDGNTQGGDGCAADCKSLD